MLEQAGARVVLVLGGARSGKSAFAEKLALSSQRSVAFIATATAGDEEMQERIAHHRAARPQHWHTLEEPLDLAGAVRQASSLADVLILDCLTLWTANWLLQQPGLDWEQPVVPGAAFSAQNALKEIETMLAVAHSMSPQQTLIIVSNEVGLGLVPDYPLGRAYRDALGSVNQAVARIAERVYLLVAGIPVDIKRLQEDISLFTSPENPAHGYY